MAWEGQAVFIGDGSFGLPGDSKRYDKDKARISFSLPLLDHCSCVQLREYACRMMNASFQILMLSTSHASICLYDNFQGIRMGIGIEPISLILSSESLNTVQSFMASAPNPM